LNLYLDTSALVKLYAHEAESFTVRRHVTASKRIATSRVAYAEARAALARRAREGRTRPSQLRRAVAKLDADWQKLVVVELDASLTQRAGELAEERGLRGFDAIHLACALRLATELAAPVTFLAFDLTLASAAKAEGLTVP
jgi:uncharacterized protein